MTVILVILFIVGCVLIATEKINHINKAAVAIFLGTLCWLLYLIYGTSYVTAEHAADFVQFLDGRNTTVGVVRDFIANSVFMHYVADACEIILFLLATMTIVEVLSNNGCFEFLSEWLRTRSALCLLWTTTGITFILSANLDNLTTVCLMLSITHTLVASRRQRMIYGAMIVIAANCGGAFTVIGDMTSLILWVKGVVTPTHYSGVLFLPCLTMWIVTGLLMMRHLPHHLELVETAPRFRGDDTTLGRSQRLFFLVIGIGGLWFIPTFHRITHLSPFVGAMCVLAFLWIFHELSNRKLLKSEQMPFLRRFPLALQYANIQTILFILGMSMAIGAIQETGALRQLAEWCSTNVSNVYVIGLFMGALSVLLDGIVVILTNVSTFAPSTFSVARENMHTFATDGLFWPLLSFCTAWGGSLLAIGSMAGYSLMRMENVTLAWYFRFVTWKVFLGGLCGLAVLIVVAEWIY
mgnify:CR=1 FL=1